MRWNPEDYAKNSNAQLKWARELRRFWMWAYDQLARSTPDQFTDGD
jgi:hypothetical protein